MKIVVAHPPIIERIAQVFPHALGPNVIFAWGDTIFNPSGISIPKHIVDHEKVHGQRQGKDILGWWKRYLEEVEFRLEEEIVAHQAEYRGYVKRHGPSAKKLAEIGSKLAGPLYNHMLTAEQAQAAVLTGRLMSRPVLA